MLPKCHFGLAASDFDTGRNANEGQPPDVLFLQCFMYDWYGIFKDPPSAKDDAMGEFMC